MSDTLDHILTLLPQLTPDEKLRLVDEISFDLYGEDAVIDVRRRGETIVIPLTRNELTYHYLSVEKHKDFFPADAVGEADSSDAAAKPLTLRFEGLRRSLRADISPERYRLRLPGDALEEFFKLSKVKAGDQLVIERQSDYEYWVYRIK